MPRGRASSIDFQTNGVVETAIMASIDIDLARPRNQPLVRALTAVNAVFAGLVLGAWTYIALFVGNPIAWATWSPVRRGSSWEEFFSYPYVMLWGLPVMALLVSWMARKSGLWRLAAGVLLTPVLFLGLTIFCYYVLPNTAG
jgi:hypothetical protein